MGQNQPIVITLQESPVIESELEGLVVVARTGLPLVLVIFAAAPAGAASGPGPSLPDRVRACGIGPLAEISPCDRNRFRSALKQASEMARSDSGRIAVILVTSPCAETGGAVPADLAGGCEECYGAIGDAASAPSIFELAQRTGLVDKFNAHPDPSLN